MHGAIEEMVMDSAITGFSTASIEEEIGMDLLDNEKMFELIYNSWRYKWNK